MSKKSEYKEKKRREKRIRNILLISIIIVAALAIVFLLIISLQNSASAPIGEIATIEPVSRLTDGVPSDTLGSGDPSSPIVVEIYSDFQCPGCKYFSDNYEPTLITQYINTGLIYYIYRPLSFLDGNTVGDSKRATMAAFCANEQGRFWDFHDMLFANQTAENVGDFTVSRLEAFAATLGLDTTAFNECLESERYLSEVTTGNNLGTENNISSTPSILINGEPFLPQSDWSELFTQIDSLLAQNP
jgi:protein-disulfide isomerase